MRVSRRAGCFVAGSLLLASAAGAATITVTSNGDLIANGDGCTLREAILNANADSQAGSAECAAGTGVDSIVFAAPMTIAFTQLGGPLPLLSDLERTTVKGDVNGDAIGDVTLDGAAATNFMGVVAGADVSLTHLTFQFGHGGAVVVPAFVPISGGAIGVYDSTLTVDHCVFSDNSSAWGYLASPGGAIYSSNSSLTVRSSTFKRNVSLDSGGAISASGAVLVQDSTFSENLSADYWDLGGAIHLDGNGTVSNSTFLDNGDRNYGGAVFVGSGSLTLLNDTFSNTNAPISVIAGSVTMSNCIVTGNTALPKCYGSVTDGGGNLRWPANDPSCPGTAGDPGLLAVGDNGGPTATMALQAGSAAIDAGVDAICAESPVSGLDQRGVPRPADGNSDGVAHCDIGAFELGNLIADGFESGTDCAWPVRAGSATPCPATVRDIQTGATSGGVRIANAVITAFTADHTHLWVADSWSAEPYEGVYVYRGSGAAALGAGFDVGDEVGLTGFTYEYGAAFANSLTEIITSQDPVLIGPGQTAPNPLGEVGAGTLSDITLGEPLEGVLVRIGPVKAQAALSGNRVPLVDNRGGTVKMYGLSYPYGDIPSGTCFAEVTGIMNLYVAFGERQLLPRSAADLVVGTGCN